jgi:putative spermidine/putrescine transport system substrate-binding protein
VTGVQTCALPICEGKNLKITWTGGIYDLDYWVMPKGTPNKDAALKFIAAASSADAQAEYAKNISYGPTNNKALAKLDAKVLGLLPTSTANSKDALQFNIGFWADQGEALEKRFSAWAAQ